MKTAKEIILESKIADILLDLVYDAAQNGIYDEMTTSDLQGYCQAKAMDIIRMVKGAA